MVSQRITGILLAALLTIGVTTPSFAMTRKISLSTGLQAVGIGAAFPAATAASAFAFWTAIKNPICAAWSSSEYTKMSQYASLALIGITAAGALTYYIKELAESALADHTGESLEGVQQASRIGTKSAILAAIITGAYYVITQLKEPAILPSANNKIAPAITQKAPTVSQAPAAPVAPHIAPQQSIPAAPAQLKPTLAATPPAPKIETAPPTEPTPNLAEKLTASWKKFYKGDAQL